MTEALKVYSIVIAWDDHDSEQGDFGETVRAESAAAAERIVRARMCWAHWRDYRMPGESRRESLSSYDDGVGNYFGSVIDCHEGAIWMAADLEAALRGLLAEVDKMAGRIGWAGHGGRETARKIIAEIDAL